MGAGTYNALRGSERNASRCLGHGLVSVKYLHNPAIVDAGVGSGKRRLAARTFRGLEVLHTATASTPCTSSPHDLVDPIARHGGRSYEISPSQPVVGASSGAPAKPRHIALQARNHCDNMAQSKGSPAVSRETHHTWKEKYRGYEAESDADLLCMDGRERQ